MEQKRLDYFDVAKGISMICIIMGHLGIIEINSFVYTFHVPVFFLISGYFLSDERSMKDEIIKKGKRLLYPYVITCLCTICGISIRYLYQNDWNIHGILEIMRTWLIASLYGNGGMIEHLPSFVTTHIGAIWFLPALFFSIIIVKFFLQYNWGIIAILICAYIGYQTKEIIWLPMSIQSGMFATIFVYIGYLAHKKNVFEYTNISPAILSGLAVIWTICITNGGKVYLVQNYVCNGVLDILGALSGSYFIIIFSKFLCTNMLVITVLLKFFGKNSLIVLCMHAFELKIFSWEWVRQLAIGNNSVFRDACILIVMKIIYCTIGIWGLKLLYRHCLKHILIRVRMYLILLEKRYVLPKNSERMQYWDIAKGIAIISCVLGHCEVPSYLRVLIFSFHMPLFFIANGYFIKKYDIKRTLLNSTKSLLAPYVITCMLSAFIYMSRAANDYSRIQLFLEKIITMIGGMSKISTKFHSLGSVWLVWFVCCLFIARNLYVILMKLLENYSDSFKLGIILAFSIGGYYIGAYYAFMPWSLDVAMVALIFFAFAQWMRKNELLEKNYFYTLVAPAIIWIYFIQKGIHIEMATRSYPLGLLSIIEAIAGSLVVISVSKLLENIKLVSSMLSWCGKNSMIILIFHCLEMMYMDWYKWVFQYLPFSMNWFRVFVIKMIIILFATMLYNCLKNIARIKIMGMRAIAK